MTCHSWQSMKYRYNSRLAKKNVNEANADNLPKVQETKKQVQNLSLGFPDETLVNGFVFNCRTFNL